MALSPPAVGIDLGTTYSCVAVHRPGGRIDVIANEHGLRTTPSCVAFEEGQRIVGKEARDNSYLRPTHTVFAIKRIIGRKYDDPEVQSYQSKWPFPLVRSDTGLPEVEMTETEHVNAESRTTTKRFKPEEISALVLGKMKSIADDFLNTQEVRLKAVITVPANFNDAQRRATKTAGEKAGLEVLAVVNEPTAAAVAYGLDKIRETQTILVFDLGGGTLDVSILRIENGRKFEVLSTCGNLNLGGEDFDQRLLEHCIGEFEAKHNVTVDRAGQGVARLRLKVEEIKKSLTSARAKHILSVDAFHGDKHLISTISTAKFDELCADLFAKTLEPVQEALQRANLDRTDINQIVLVGGCSRILKIREILADFFPGQPINRDINADEAIACGAANLAYQLANENAPVVEDDIRIQFSDVTPFSLGTEIAGGYMVTLIAQNTKIPAKETRDFTTEQEGQWWVDIPIYEGEARVARENRLLGKFRFRKFRRGRAGGPQIAVTFEYDRSGIVHVTAMDKSTGLSAAVQVNRNESGDGGSEEAVSEEEEAGVEAEDFRDLFMQMMLEHNRMRRREDS
ncbi:heat shock cognate 71 kDa protein-like [Paramacrobiotus metropolitanus]|uniref:heat shock cognate 71 kDa protein-like n=1 Tax=Paramacrobiotus metropolitanus TaxID=2943436 RepID=UPI00244640C9|nr:heat shock cognate 71 kDa protein-like [Paramacrobiotus metropolitanus]XP_055348894.1 heat shock cognate 71 kDa protein-like [Paramacrobiotus metropolitanus]